MRATSRSPHLTVAYVSLCTLLVASATLAQSPSPRLLADPAVVPDDMLTLVVGTRFVTAEASAGSPRAQFDNARLPLSSFNETDRCVDQLALEAAQEYFTSLGRLLGKAGHFYFIPEAEIEKSVRICEKLHGRPQAWADEENEDHSLWKSRAN